MQISNPSEEEILELLASKEAIVDTAIDDTINRVDKKEVSSSSVSSDIDELITPSQGWRKVTGLNHPAEFQAFFDDNIINGKVTHYPWQIRISESIGQAKATAKHPYKLALCTCNGSGKDKFVITPTVLWFICTKIRSLVVITSAGGVQLTNQTENDIRILAEKINAWSSHPDAYGEPILKIKQRKIYCTLTGSMIVLFATDEPAKAEGYHPLEPDAEMMIVINEAKSVNPDIFNALRRCTGFNYWLLVSSPGQPAGPFHEAWHNWPNSELITYYDCPHHSVDEFEYDKRMLGEHDWLFRSKWLGLFTFIGGKTVVNEAAIKKLRHQNKAGEIKSLFQNREIRVGIDIALSANGDESIITAFRGNRQLKLKPYRIQDATLLAEAINKELLELKINKDHPYIYADDGGVGRAVIDILKRMGWTGINRVLNQSPAKNKKQYRNRGAELWYKLARLIEHQCLILLDDDKMYSQIMSRKYKESIAGVDKLTLQSKKEMMSEGLNSPDRADAVVLALCDVHVNDWIDKLLTAEDSKAPTQTKEEMLRSLMRELRRGEVADNSTQEHSYYSMNAILGSNKKRFNYEGLPVG